MAIQNMDQLIAALGDSTTVKRWNITKGSITTVAGAYFALWTVPGCPGAAAAPASGVNGELLTDATAGAFPFTNPTGGKFSYLSFLGASANNVGTLYLYDRLWQNSGLSVTSTTPQAIAPSALNRPDANGADVEAWLEIIAATGAGATTPTIEYTDQDGNITQAGTCIGYSASSAIYRCYPFQLAAGDTGIRAITSYDTGSTSMSSGSISLVLRRKIAQVMCSAAGVAGIIDAISSGMPRIYDDACLELIWHCATTTLVLTGEISIMQG